MWLKLRSTTISPKQTVTDPLHIFLKIYKGLNKEMSNNKEILIGVKIQVNNEKAIREIVESQKQIDELKKKQTELTEAFKEGAISEEEYRKGMEEYRTQIEQSAFKVRALRKEIQTTSESRRNKKGL